MGELSKVILRSGCVGSFVLRLGFAGIRVGEGSFGVSWEEEGTD